LLAAPRLRALEREAQPKRAQPAEAPALVGLGAHEIN